MRLINNVCQKDYSRKGVNGIIELGGADMAKLICPSCGSSTSFNPVWVNVRGVLEGHSTKDNTVWGEVSVKLIEPYEYGIANYAILECQACGKRLVVENGEYAEKDFWEVAYPIHHKVASEEIPEPIKSEFEEAELCFAVGTHRACVAMCEIALEALWREKRASGLQELQDKGVISTQLYNRATEVRLWGNIAKHELIPDVVKKVDAEQLLAYLEILLNDVYVEPRRLDNLRQKRSQIEKKQT